MEVVVRQMGISYGVSIPELILARLGMEGIADMGVRDGVIEIRPAKRLLTQRLATQQVGPGWSSPDR